MQITDITKIEWKVMRPLPGEFRCFICHIRDAEYHLAFRHGDLDCKMPVCDTCRKIPEETLVRVLKLKAIPAKGAI